MKGVDIKKISSVIILSFFIVFLFVGCDKSSSYNREVDYKLQKQCGEDSEKFFKRQYKEYVDSLNIFYQNHYNKKLNKCFIIVNRSSPTFRTLFDVNESKIYGMFSSGGGSCFVLDKKCNDEKEFDSLVKPYMEE
jgi:hypothetical protein